MQLTAPQLAQFDRDGYLYIRHLLGRPVARKNAAY